MSLLFLFFGVVFVFMATMKNEKYKIQNQEIQYQKMQYQSTSTHPPTSSQQQWHTTINEKRKNAKHPPNNYGTLQSMKMKKC